MKYYITFFLLFIASACLNETEKRIKIFEENIGVNKAKVLTNLVSEFELAIMKVYETNNLEEAYYKYFRNNIETKRKSTLFCEEKIIEVRRLLNKSGLGEKETYPNGIFFKSLEASARKDSFVLNHLISKDAMGVIPDFALSNALIELKVDVNDYFVKRIVLVEFFY